MKIFNFSLFVISIIVFQSGCGSNNAANSSIEPMIDEQNSQVASPVDNVKPSAIDQANTTLRASINNMGEGGNQNSIQSAISADGQIIVFDSSSDNLVVDDLNNNWDIFGRNRRDGTTHRLSVGFDGSESNGDSLEPHLSMDGRFVVFSSKADNLVANDNNRLTDIFVRDLSTGINERVSINSDGTEADGDSSQPRISADGRFVVFTSTATNLSIADNDVGKDIYLHDRDSGKTIIVSTNSLGVPGNGDSMDADVNGNGLRISFVSNATNLIDVDNNDSSDVFVKYLDVGDVVIVSVNSQDILGDGNSDTPSISHSGQYVAFRSSATNLVDVATSNFQQVYVRDIDSGITELVSVDSLGVAANTHVLSSTAISHSGRFVAFYTGAELTVGDTNSGWDVYVRDRLTNETKLASVNSAGEVGNASSFLPALSQFGNYLSFGSQSSNLVDDDTNGAWDIFVHVLTPHNFPPVANISIDQLSGDAPFTIMVNGLASSDPENDELLFHWNFGDANSLQNSSDMVSATHLYETPGSYTVLLTVTDSAGNSTKSFTVIEVTAANMPPTVLPSVDIQSGVSPLTVQFQANAEDPEQGMLSYQWLFGDGSESDQADPLHTFTAPGVYQVSVTVSDGEFEVIGTVTIVVDSSINMITTKAMVKFEHNGHVNGSIMLQAKVPLADLGIESNWISLSLDQYKVFEIQVSEFDDSDDSSELEYEGENLKIKIDLEKGRLKVKQNKILISDAINNIDGVDVVLTIGQQGATENIVMRELNKHKCHDKHTDDNDGHCNNNKKNKVLVYKLSHDGDHDEDDEDEEHDDDHDDDD